MTMPDKDQGRGTLGIIHGWGFDSQVMAGLAAELSPCWNTRLIDMPGYGHHHMTGFPPGNDNFASNLISAIPPYCMLVGWSLGGMVAIKIAHSMQDKIKAIILLASTPCFVRKHDWPHGIESTQIKNMAKRVSTENNEVLQEFAGLTARGDISPKETIREFKLMHKMNKVDPRVLLQGLDILINTDLRIELSELKCRVIMLLGDRDQLVASSTGNATREILPSLQLNYIKAAGHAPFVSKSKQWAEATNNSLPACGFSMASTTARSQIALAV